ncbi:IclR family transcriptional regulator [Corynebacterium canis]|uniref:IclR family transcriptional regulator n=1 Tax=Corynebacterium canis TaxID=679663 RepID=A0A5C5UI10_9CORY|nr:IclR family transcriptional regulator [Corynebacterium canis]TWT25499.1 IclR family transcriptional regulator [Corynebacterium canis]WJY76188.1 Transcriptional regulator KdgR [Corynebacterium canis]
MNSAKPADTRSAVDKAFSLLRSFSDHDTAGVGVSELARRAEMSKSTAHRLLATLVANGAVERSGEVYRLGPLCFELTSDRGTRTSDILSEILTPFLAVLFERTRQTVHLAALQGNEVVYINKLFSARRIASPSRIGGRAPAYCTGVGKAMLAWDPVRAESAISSGLHRWTPYTITDPEEIREELATIRKDGIAHDRQEIALGLSCIAAPIFGRNNEPIAAMSVSGASSQFKPEEHILALKRICAAAGRAALEHQRNLERTA